MEIIKFRGGENYVVVGNDSSYLKASTAVFPNSSYNNSFKISGISPTLSTTANPATVTATDAQDIHIFPSNNPQSEVHISLNLTNHDNLLVSAQTNWGLGNAIQGYYYSNDGGNTWQGSDILPNNAYGRGDPTTAFDASGNGYIGTMGPDPNNPPDGYLIQKTTDGGSTWQAQIRGDGPVSHFDKEMIVADNISSSKYYDNLYAAWSIINDSLTPPAGYKVQFNLLQRNSNTFSNPITLEDGWGQGTNVQTGPNGNVYVCWANYGNNTYPANGIGFARLINGGTTIDLDNIAFSYNGIRTSGGPNSTFGNTRINDFPSMAVDKSNLHPGRIYITYPEEVSGKAVIQVRYSDNEGNNWSTANTVSISSGSQSWFPWIAVDPQNGWVSVDYYCIDGSNYQTDTYVATSFDGGDSWYNTKVSDVSHTTAPIPNFKGGYAGDYIGIAAYGGKAYPVWSDNRNGTWQIYISPVTLSPPPYQVIISGPLQLSNGQQGTWTAQASGGQPGYSYVWQYEYACKTTTATTAPQPDCPGCGTGCGTWYEGGNASSFSLTANSTYYAGVTLEVTATDALGNTTTDQQYCQFN
jgi:hypothetical protein